MRPAWEPECDETVVVQILVVAKHRKVVTMGGFGQLVRPYLAAGYQRGWLDELLSRLSDLVLAFPALVLYIIIVSKFGASGLNIVLAVTLASSPAIMRLTRGLTLALRNRAFVAKTRCSEVLQ